VQFVVDAVFCQESRDVANTCDDSKPICISIGGGSLYQSRFLSLFTPDESERDVESANSREHCVRFMPLRLCERKAIVDHPSRNNEKIKTRDHLSLSNVVTACIS
jgi:hypothetical protein